MTEGLKERLGACEGKSGLENLCLGWKGGFCWKEFILIQELLVPKYDSSEMYLSIKPYPEKASIFLSTCNAFQCSYFSLHSITEHSDLCHARTIPMPVLFVVTKEDTILSNTIKSKLAWLSPQARILQLGTYWQSYNSVESLLPKIYEPKIKTVENKFHFDAVKELILQPCYSQGKISLLSVIWFFTLWDQKYPGLINIDYGSVTLVAQCTKQILVLFPVFYVVYNSVLAINI